jgi:hypothetical protein
VAGAGEDIAAFGDSELLSSGELAGIRATPVEKAFSITIT